MYKGNRFFSPVPMATRYYITVFSSEGQWKRNILYQRGRVRDVANISVQTVIHLHSPHIPGNVPSVIPREVIDKPGGS